MNGKEYGNNDFIIVDANDVDCIVDDIIELSGYFVTYPDDADNAPAATAAFHTIRELANKVKPIVYEMIGDTTLRIKQPVMAVEEPKRRRSNE